MTADKPVAIVLAAGRGRRFVAAGGAPFKQSQALHGTRSVVEHVCDLYAASGLTVVCALHPALRDIGRQLAAAGHRVVRVADADHGMGHSLAAAVAAAPSQVGWLVGLADMPRIRPATIRAVAEALGAGAPLCAPFHEGRRGHPVGFSEEFGPALRALAGDEGARSILRANEQRLRRIEVDDPGVAMDIDVPDDLQSRDIGHGQS